MTLVIPHTVRRQFIFDSAKMDVAVLIDHETCLNHLGLRCDVCYRVCPVIDKAITLELVRNTRTGRGRCIDVCSKDVFTFGSRSHSPALQPPGIY